MNKYFYFFILIIPFIFPLKSPAEQQAEGILKDMVLVPAGEFKAGKPGSLKSIRLDAYYIDRYEVAQEKYEKAMGENRSFFKGARRPVEKVAWFEADEFCRKIGKRLPTEWEWEKAAKAGTASAYYWGDEFDQRYSWSKENSGKQSHPVGQKRPNGFGLYDMSGNVWEWTASDHESGGKVQRGGSWRSSGSSAKSAHRILSLPHFRYHYVGFRCAVSITP